MRVALNPITGDLVKKEIWRQTRTHTHRARPRDNGDRDLSDASTRRGTPPTDGDQEGPCPRAVEGARPCRLLGPKFPASRTGRTNVCHFTPPGQWRFAPTTPRSWCTHQPRLWRTRAAHAHAVAAAAASTPGPRRRLLHEQEEQRRSQPSESPGHAGS